MKLAITISIAFVMFYIGTGAPVDDLDEDYDYAIALLSESKSFYNFLYDL